MNFSIVTFKLSFILYLAKLISAFTFAIIFPSNNLDDMQERDMQEKQSLGNIIHECAGSAIIGELSLTADFKLRTEGVAQLLIKESIILH